MLEPRAVVLLDFSGTLSLGAVLFARPASLVEALQRSHLWELGVDSLQVFWEEIVNPTWEEGSTTGKGYRRLLCERVRELARRRGIEVDEDELKRRAAAFVAAYLARSAIDPAWGTVLRALASRPSVAAIVATDHYAEATAHIVGELTALGLAAAPALSAQGPGVVLVANSADLGAPKASRGFWERLWEALGAPPIARAVIVDDLGANEQPQDSYAAPEMIQRRMAQMVQSVAAVFRTQVAAFPFVLGQEADMDRYHQLIRNAADFICHLVDESA